MYNCIIVSRILKSTEIVSSIKNLNVQHKMYKVIKRHRKESYGGHPTGLQPQGDLLLR